VQHSVLVIGGGSIGERHVRCFQRTGRADVSLCEINADVRQRVGTQYALPATYSDLNDALAAKPQLVVVCTPAHLHIPQAIHVVAAGAHVLIEKPLSTSLEGIDALHAALHTHARTAGVAYVYRAHPALQQMRQSIAAGEFGPPLQVVVQSGQHFPLYRPAYRDIYYRDRATGGGAIQDALTHLVNAVEWLVGSVTRVAADTDHLRLEGVSVEDTVHVIARHGNVMASYSLNQHQAPNESTITVVCANGTARFESHNCRWLAAINPGEAWQDRATFTLERDDLFVRQAATMLDAIEGKSPVACTIDEAIQTLRVNLTILEATETHSWQTITPGERRAGAR
jgi:predicted dehydrogenase